MQITLTMQDINRLAALYLEELGFSLKDKDITCILQAARKDPYDSKIIVEVYQGSSVPMKTAVEPLLSVEEDTQEEIIVSDEESKEVVKTTKKSLFE